MINLLIERYPALSQCRQSTEEAVRVIEGAYCRGGKLLLAGNGGSAADCDHIVGELMKGFLLSRPLPKDMREKMKERSEQLSAETLDRLQCGLPAISLPSISALNTAFSNDCDPALIFAQSVLSLGKEGDVLLAISTSGNAENVVRAAEVARGLGLTVISLTGKSGGRLARVADVAIRVPESETFKVQELHLPLYHAICAEIEKYFFG